MNLFERHGSVESFQECCLIHKAGINVKQKLLPCKQCISAYDKAAAPATNMATLCYHIPMDTTTERW